MVQIEWGYASGGRAWGLLTCVGNFWIFERKNRISAISGNGFSGITFERFEIIERGFVRLLQVPKLRRPIKFGEDRKPETGNTAIWIFPPKFAFKFPARFRFCKYQQTDSRLRCTMGVCIARQHFGKFRPENGENMAKIRFRAKIWFLRKGDFCNFFWRVRWMQVTYLHKPTRNCSNRLTTDRENKIRNKKYSKFTVRGT